MTNADIAAIVDLERYPLDRPDAASVQALLTDGRQALRDRALFQLPGFIQPSATVLMARELEALRNQALRYDFPRLAYDDETGETWPAGHPRTLRADCRYHQVLNYQIPNDSLLRQVYYWAPLAAFLQRVVGYETFYRSECPHLALSSKIAHEGDTDGWHFDSNDVVFSVLLQAPTGGGAFEYVPYIRNGDRENYDGVADVMQGKSENVVNPSMQPGDLTVFMGDESLHRVSPVEGDRSRIVALFCYDRHQGMTFSESYVKELSGFLPAGSAR